MNNKEKNLSAIRAEYLNGTLDENSVQPDPVSQFRIWMDEAINAEIVHPTAVLLATANAKGSPSLRVVLLKDVSEAGFTFFTHYGSRKGREIAENPHVALTFFWNGLERQVRIEGTAGKVSGEISDKYFYSRPYESRLSAAASPQSKSVINRKHLEQLRDEIKQEHPGNHIPRPDQWGGYLVEPVYVEFWQGRENRLHDRILYSRENNSWKISRLAP